MVSSEDMPKLCSYAAEDPREPDTMMYCSTKKIPITVCVARRDRFGRKNMGCLPCTIKEEIAIKEVPESQITSRGTSQLPRVTMVNCNKRKQWVVAEQLCVSCPPNVVSTCKGFEEAMNKSKGLMNMRLD